MKLKNNETKIHKCCNDTCDNELEEQGPINTYLKRLLADDNTLEKGFFEVKEKGRGEGFSAQFNVLQDLDHENSILRVTIYCRMCGSICKY